MNPKRAMLEQKIKHFPVLLKEYIKIFDGKEIDFFLDGTLGAAGHARAILEAHPEIKTFIGLDKDQVALDLANENLKPWMSKANLFHENFKNLDKVLDEMNIEFCDGMFFDIGLSSMQVDEPERGFSFRYDAELDMRMDQNTEITAKDIINTWPEKKLEEIFREYGEERNSKKAAKEIVEKRRRNKINTTFELIKVLEPVLGKRRKIHPVTKIFQALRICVNDELNSLKEGLNKAILRLREDGIIGVISFHSLEDRIVKHTFKDDETLEVITKKPIRASFGEKNKRARSAKMRFAKKRKKNE
ncbi:MAG: Ribosomal RNA small subunit methyltransferase H [Candidatus Anoxychlamydiales bacterium]|nr:Ribosomal RNA small subunit methyltransferase H [Candidatus Anoxychlamydiales bacterium]